MAEVVEQVLIQVNLENSQIKTELVATKDRIADFKAKAKEAADQLKELQKDSEKNAVAISNQKEKIVDLNSALQAEIKNQNTLQLALTKTEQANRLEAGSLAQKRAALAAGQTAYAQYGEEQTKTDENAIALRLSLEKLKEEILSEAKAIGSTVENVGNYKQAIKEARLEAEAAEIQFKKGIIDEKTFKEALDKYGELKEAKRDFEEASNAATGEGRIAAFSKAAAGIAGGFASAQGAMALFGTESEDVQKALLKVQSAMAIAQGLKQFSELGDTFNALKLSLGLVTAGQTANNVEVGEGVVVQQAAIVTSAQLRVAMSAMLGPIGLIVLGIGAVAAAFALLNDKDFAKELDDIAKSAETENAAHEKTIEKLGLIADAEVQRAENALKVAEAEGKSSAEIKQLADEVLQAKKNALIRERVENETHIAELETIRNEASQRLLEDLDEEEIEKAKKIIEGAKKEIDAIKKREEEIKLAKEQIEADKQLSEIKAAQELVSISNEASKLRISGIKNNRQRELEEEKNALATRLTELLKDEEKNNELIYELRDASARKVAEINLKYDIQSQEDKNRLAVLKTVEGSEARLEAETKGIIKLRNLQLQQTGLTENQKQLIITESNQKIFDLETATINARLSLQDNELAATRARQTAILEARKANATNPEEKVNAELEIINQKFSEQIAAINKGETDKVAALERSSANDIALAKGNKEAIEQIELDKQTQLNTIRFNGEAARIKATTEASGATLQVVAQSKNDELSRETFLIGQKLSLLASGSEQELQLKEQLIRTSAEKLKLSYENDAEARKAIDAKANQDIELLRAEHVANLVEKGAELYSQIEGLSSIASQNEDIRNQNELKKDKDKNDKLKASLKTQLDSGLITQATYDKKVLELDTQLTEKQNKLKREAFASQKNADLIQAGINTALAVTRALAAPPGFPLNAGSVALAGVLGLAQVGLIAGRPTPEYFAGGYTETGNPYNVSRYSNSTRTLHYGEHVSPAWMIKDPFTAPIIAGMEDYRIGNPSTLKSMLGYFSGGFVPETSFVSSSVSAPVFDAYAMASAVAQGVAALELSVSVQEINTVASNIRVNESGANS